MKICDLIEAKAEPIYYFAYGMLTDPALMRGAIKVGPATLKNFQLEFREYANLIRLSGSTVGGALWAITKDMISYLDRIEGYPRLYDRKTVPVYANGKKYAAEVYILTPSSRELLQNSTVNNDYINRLIVGYTHFGLSQEQITKALVGKKFDK